jgi:hypothetical protein
VALLTFFIDDRSVSIPAGLGVLAALDGALWPDPWWSSLLPPTIAEPAFIGQMFASGLDCIAAGLKSAKKLQLSESNDPGDANPGDPRRDSQH